MSQVTKKAPPKKGTNKRPTRGEAAAKMAAYGFDRIVGEIEQDDSYTQIAKRIGCSTQALIAWVEADSERSARAKIARQKSADACDEKALLALQEIDDDAQNGQITRQREIASHYRWRAKVRNPRVYGDKLALDAEVSVKTMTDEQLLERAKALADKLGLSTRIEGKKILGEIPE